MANIFSNFINSMKLSDDDDLDEDEFEPDEDLDGLDYSEDAGKSQGYKFKSSRVKAKDDKDYDFEEKDLDDDSDEPRKTPVRNLFSTKKTATMPISSAKSQMEVCMIKPVNMNDAKEVCDILIQGKAVVINMEGVNFEMAQRIIDFSSGACYSMNGNFQTISRYIFIVTPSTINLSGDFARASAVNTTTAND